MLLRKLTVGVAAIAFAGVAEAQTATQVVQFQVNAINQIAVTGSVSPMVINSATAGSAPASVTSTGSTYAISTNESNQKITASIDQPMPSGVQLEVALVAPGGASSAGNVTLGTASADLVTGISSTAASSLPITYRLSATPIAQVSPSTRTVTFTIVAGT
jgi:hypothetical protein